MSGGTIIETERLRLRPFHERDLTDLIAFASDWEVARWLAHLPHPYHESDGRAWIAHIRDDHATGRPIGFAVALKEDDRLIGGGGLDGSRGDAADEPALGYWLGRPHWGKGYGREAVAAFVRYGFDMLGHAALRAYTDPDNLRSQRVLLACGLLPAGEIDLAQPTHHGATRVPLFRIVKGGLA